jgi:single-strand DNA-binding protein
MFQNLIFVGNLGNDPELRYTPSGQAVATLNVAVNREYPNAEGEKVKEVTWFRVSTWGKLAEICAQYLAKGRQVLIEGRLVPDKESGGPKVWTRTDGTPGANYEVNAETVRFLGKGEGSAPAEEGAPSEDIPF